MLLCSSHRGQYVQVVEMKNQIRSFILISLLIRIVQYKLIFTLDLVQLVHLVRSVNFGLGRSYKISELSQGLTVL